MNKEKLHKEFGKLVQFYRKEKGFTQEDLAEAIDKSFETVSNIERGFASTRIATAAEIAQVLGIELQQLFAFQKKEPEKIIAEIIKEIKMLEEKDQRQILRIVRTYRQ